MTCIVILSGRQEEREKVEAPDHTPREFGILRVHVSQRRRCAQR